MRLVINDDVCFRNNTSGKLVDMRSDEVIEIIDNSFVADVDVNWARLFRLDGQVT